MAVGQERRGSRSRAWCSGPRDRDAPVGFVGTLPVPANLVEAACGAAATVCLVVLLSSAFIVCVLSAVCA